MQQKYPSASIQSVRCCATDIVVGISGGSIASAINLAEHYPLRDLSAALKPFGLSPIKPRQSVRAKDILHDDRLGGWIGPWLMSPVNAATVCRTYGLLQGKWGDRFSYREYMTYGSWWKAKAMSIALKLAGVMLAIPPVRWILRKYARASGKGPSQEEMENGRLVMKILAETDDEPPRTGSITVSADADPAYLLTGRSHASEY